MAWLLLCVDLNRDLSQPSRRFAVRENKIEGANLDTSFRPTKVVRIGGFSFVLMTSSFGEMEER